MRSQEAISRTGPARKKSSSQNARNLRRLLVEAMALEPQEIGARIKRARELAGLRQEDLADIINVSNRTVQNLEAGDVKPYVHLGRIADALNVTQEWLLHGDPDTEATETELSQLRAEIGVLRRMLEELLRREESSS